KASYENLKKNIRIQVKEAWLSLEEAKKRIESTKGVVERAQENLNSKMLRYRNGLISQLELNDAISDLNDSNLTYVQAVYDAHVALSNLNYAVGMETEDYE
ncbi:MAG: TolC family protein, partial [Elusimicrobia bacterium]|nr:TolC family protein [Elusimicrobiota bacterium]